MKIELKLPIPYSKYDVSFEYSKLIPLSEFESLIVILIFCKNKGEITKTDNLIKVIKEKYNLNDSFIDLFKEPFKKLLSTETIISKEKSSNINDDSFFDVLIGNLDLNKDVQENIEADNFLGIKNEPFFRKSTFISNLITKTGFVQIKENFKHVELKDDQDLSFFVEVNKKINQNYKTTFDLKANLLKDNDEAYKKHKISSGEKSVPLYENIYFNDEEITFNYDEGSLYSTDKLSEEIIELFSKNIFYTNLPNMIIKTLETKILAPITNQDLLSIEDKNIDSMHIFQIDSKIFYVLGNVIIQLFNKNQELLFNNVTNASPLFYKKLCKLEVDSYDEIILYLLNDQNKNLLLTIYEKVNNEVKEAIINILFADNTLFKQNLLFVKKEIKDCLPKLKEKSLNDLSNLLLEDNELFLDVLKNDSDKRQYIDQLKTSNIAKILHKEIINIYKLSYDGETHNLKDSHLEDEINSFYTKYKSLNYNVMNELETFKIELNNWKGINSNITFVFITLEQKLNSSIRQLELKEIEKKDNESLKKEGK
ncbi:MAG: hypothetical protein KFW07_01000 [Mycoplasmataceae bacterium]|nr:hypothetical protein [Mycoplasmataceae bacterium]